MNKAYNTKQLLTELDKYQWMELHVHHTYIPNHSNFTGTNHIALNNGMRNYHMNTLKWSNIGQHLTLFPDGVFLDGRDFNQSPASISGQNKVGALAVEMVGNFDTGNDKFDGVQKEAMLTLANYFIGKNLTIKFHNEYSKKTCPGTSIDKVKFIAEAKALTQEPTDVISAWAVKSWNKATVKGINDGKGAQNTITEEQLMVFFDRLGLLD